MYSEKAAIKDWRAALSEKYQEYLEEIKCIKHCRGLKNEDKATFIDFGKENALGDLDKDSKGYVGNWIKYLKMSLAEENVSALYHVKCYFCVCEINGKREDRRQRYASTFGV